PDQVVQEARARLEKRWHLAVTDPDCGDWPFRISLGTPPKAMLERDFRTALTWARNWEEWATARQLALDWRTRLVIGTTQPLPTWSRHWVARPPPRQSPPAPSPRLVIGTTQPLRARVTSPDADAAARVCGDGWPQPLRQARHCMGLVTESFPDADHAQVIRG